MRAFPTFYLRFPADSFFPFVGTGRRITGASSFSIFPSHRENIGTPGEQAPEQLDFFDRRRVVGNRGIGKSVPFGRTATGDQLLLKRFQFTLKLHPLCIQIS
jgi:hypothetical protein